jgi:hypothetical protein
VRKVMIVVGHGMRSDGRTEAAINESNYSMDKSQAAESDGSDQEVEDLVQNDMTRLGQSFENMSAFRTVSWHPSSQSPSRAGNRLPSASLPGTFSTFGKAKDIVRSSFRA